MKYFALVLASSGLYMAYSRWSLVAPWVIATALVFAYLATSGPLVFGRRMRAAVQAAATAGEITPDVRRLLNDPTLKTMGRIRFALLASMVFLMTMKPGLVGTLTTVMSAVTLGVLSGVILRAETHEAGEAV